MVPLTTKVVPVTTIPTDPTNTVVTNRIPVNEASTASIASESSGPCFDSFRSDCGSISTTASQEQVSPSSWEESIVTTDSPMGQSQSAETKNDKNGETDMIDQFGDVYSGEDAQSQYNLGVTIAIVCSVVLIGILVSYCCIYKKAGPVVDADVSHGYKLGTNTGLTYSTHTAKKSDVPNADLV